MDDARTGELRQVLEALGTLRMPPMASEFSLHDAVGECLRRAGLPLLHEAPIAPRRRIDFLCGGVGIEIKRGKPDRRLLLEQLSAYAQSDRVQALVLVIERSVLVPRTLQGKPLAMVSLNRLWGIAL